MLIPRSVRIARALFAIGVFLYISISAPLLTKLGIPYDAPTGNFIFKLHIGTYVLLLAFFLAHCSRGNPLSSIGSLLNQERGFAIYLATTIFLMGYSVVRYGPSGSAFIIETLMMPVICALTLLVFDDRSRQNLFFMVLGLIALNALIGIGESLLQTRLVPYTVAGGVVIKENIFRSTALLGHPLNNALITGALTLTALTLRLGSVFRTALLGLLVLGLLSFGGRTAFLLTILTLAMFFAIIAVRGILRGEFSYVQSIQMLLVSVFFIGALVGLVELTGLGERIFANLGWDGSASVRVRIWNVFDYMDAEELFFGMSPSAIQLVTYRLHLSSTFEAIENFWLLMLLQMGAIGFTLFVIGLFYATRSLWRRTSTEGRLGLLLFFAVASSNNSLAAKGSELSILFIALIGAGDYARLAAARTLQVVPTRYHGGDFRTRRVLPVRRG